MPIRFDYEVDGYKILVVDGMFDANEQRSMNDVLYKASYRRTETDNDESKHIKQWVANPLPEYFNEQVVPKVRGCIDVCFPENKLHLGRGYCNSVVYGDMTHPHRDVDPPSRNMTALIYANNEWKKTWGGETLFYDKDGEIAAAVMPKPGRLVIFHGAIEHKAGVPTRECYVARYTVAFKFRENKDKE